MLKTDDMQLRHTKGLQYSVTVRLIVSILYNNEYSNDLFESEAPSKYFSKSKLCFCNLGKYIFYFILILN